MGARKNKPEKEVTFEQSVIYTYQNSGYPKRKIMNMYGITESKLDYIIKTYHVKRITPIKDINGTTDEECCACKTNIDRCKQCKYFCKGTTSCDYILIKQEMRNCSVKDCDKFEI